MPDQDLIDRLADSAHRTDHIQLDPAQLITGGRRRIRRRRLTAATVSLAVVGAAVLTGVHATAGASQAPVAGAPPSSVTNLVQLPVDAPVLNAYRASLQYHLSARGTGLTFTTIEQGGQSLTLTTSLPRPGGVAVLRVIRPVGSATPSAGSTKTADDPDTCSILGHPIALGTCSTVNANNQLVRVAQRDERAYFAGVRRADGVLLLLQVDKDVQDYQITSYGFDKPSKDLPLDGPPKHVALADLIALVTDPKLPRP